MLFLVAALCNPPFAPHTHTGEEPGQGGAAEDGGGAGEEEEGGHCNFYTAENPGTWVKDGLREKKEGGREKKEGGRERKVALSCLPFACCDTHGAARHAAG